MPTNPFDDPPREDHTRSSALVSDIDEDEVHEQQRRGSNASAPADHQEDDSTAPVNENEKTEEPLNKKQKLVAHFKRRWMWYLIGGIILLAILLPILFLVIIPAIVQSVLNKNKLPVHSGFFQVVTPDTVELSLKFDIWSPLPVDIHPMSLELYVDKDKDLDSFLNFTLPKQHVNHNTPAIVDKETLPINNQSQLTVWVNKIFDDKMVPVNVRAKPAVNLGKLHSKADLNNIIHLPALNYLDGVAIENLDFVLPPGDDKKNIKGKINLPNAGVLGLGLGDLTFNLLSGKLKLGEISMPNVVLMPGNNSIAFTGNVEFDELFSNLGEVLSSQAKALNQGNIELTATGNSAKIKGEHITFLENVLNNKALKIPIPIFTLVGDVVGGLSNTGMGQSLGDALGDVFGNSTFLESLANNFNSTSSASTDETKKMKRAVARGSMAWNLFKMGNKLKSINMKI